MKYEAEIYDVKVWKAKKAFRAKMNICINLEAKDVHKILELDSGAYEDNKKYIIIFKKI